MHGNLWQTVLGEVELSVSRGSYVTWFKQTQALRQTDDLLLVGVPNVFVKQQMERKYNQLIGEILKRNGFAPEIVQYKIHTTSKKVEEVPESPAFEQSAPPRSTQHLEPQPASRPLPSSPGSATQSRRAVNERYTFDNFIVGSGNELAYAACQAIAANPGTKYNPLFIYGGVGIGKTHLIQAVGNAVLAAKPGSKVVYISTEQFVKEFLEAIRFKKNTDFADYYRSADVLIVDDIQFITGKEKTQEEFFHTFNALHQANKQIIVSSDRPPKDIPTLEERLRSRFTWGMSIDMQTPDFETRCAIIQTKAQSHGVELPADVVEFLSNLVQSNIRELEGVLNQLLAYCEMRGMVPDVILAKSLFATTKTRPKHISARQIIERTAKHFQVGMEDITGPKRDKDIVFPRQVAMYMLRSELHLSFPKIARELGRKDHTTAIHSVEKIEHELAADTNLRAMVSEIKERLYA